MIFLKSQNYNAIFFCLRNDQIVDFFEDWGNFRTFTMSKVNKQKEIREIIKILKNIEAWRINITNEVQKQHVGISNCNFPSMRFSIIKVRLLIFLHLNSFQTEIDSLKILQSVLLCSDISNMTWFQRWLECYSLKVEEHRATLNFALTYFVMENCNSNSYSFKREKMSTIFVTRKLGRQIKKKITEWEWN